MHILEFLRSQVFLESDRMRFCAVGSVEMREKQAVSIGLQKRRDGKASISILTWCVVSRDVT